jgi:hypothetical protein
MSLNELNCLNNVIVEQMLLNLEVNSFEKVSSSVYKVFVTNPKYGKYHFILSLQLNGERLHLLYLMDDTGITFQKINDWNKNNAFTKAYFDDGCVVLQFEFFLRWGTNYIATVNFIMCFYESWVPKFVEYVLSPQ